MTPAAPETLEEGLSPEWLTAALSLRYPGPEGRRCRARARRQPGVHQRRFLMKTADPLPDGLAPALCLKGYFGSFGSLARSAGIPEAHFYRDLEPSPGPADAALALRRRGSRLPGTASSSPKTSRPQGGVFLTSGTDYTADQVAESLAQLAVLHGATWEAERLGVGPWLATRLARTLEGRGLPEIRRNFEGDNGKGVPGEVRDAQRLVDAYRALATEAESARPWCVIHGDTHVGNLFLDATGRPSFLDWQLVQRGAWYLDVGYHIASTLPPDDRRKLMNLWRLLEKKRINKAKKAI